MLAANGPVPRTPQIYGMGSNLIPGAQQVHTSSGIPTGCGSPPMPCPLTALAQVYPQYGAGTPAQGDHT